MKQNVLADFYNADLSIPIKKENSILTQDGRMLSNTSIAGSRFLVYSTRVLVRATEVTDRTKALLEFHPLLLPLKFNFCDPKLTSGDS